VENLYSRLTLFENIIVAESSQILHLRIKYIDKNIGIHRIGMIVIMVASGSQIKNFILNELVFLMPTVERVSLSQLIFLLPTMITNTSLK
jgi:hypothetical protein